MGWFHTKNPEGHGLREDQVDWGWTEIAEVCPETKRWLEDFPHKSYRRLRFMLLEMQVQVSTHITMQVHKEFVKVELEILLVQSILHFINQRTVI